MTRRSIPARHEFRGMSVRRKEKARQFAPAWEVIRAFRNFVRVLAQVPKATQK